MKLKKKNLIAIFAVLTIIVNVLVISVNAGVINTLPSKYCGKYYLYGTTSADYYMNLGSTSMTGLLYEYFDSPKTIGIGTGLVSYDTPVSSGVRYFIAEFNQYKQYTVLGGSYTVVYPTGNLLIYGSYVPGTYEILLPNNFGKNFSYIKL